MLNSGGKRKVTGHVTYEGLVLDFGGVVTTDCPARRTSAWGLCTSPARAGEIADIERLIGIG